MKKSLYIMLLLGEAIVDFLAVSLAWVNLGWLPCVITLGIWAVLLVWQLLKLAKADKESKGKICLWIALIMLIPILGAISMFLYLFIGLAGAI